MADLDCLILCAGRGERLRPLTDVCPKPLIPIAGITMADRALAACETLAPTCRFANSYHLHQQIELWGEARGIDHVQVEPGVLDTGGVLAMLRPEIQSSHLVVHNGDVLHDIDLVQPWMHHLHTGASATLVMIDRPGVNTVQVCKGAFAGVVGHPRCPAHTVPGTYGRTFSGIAFYRVRDLGKRPVAKWSVKELWHDLLESGLPIQCWEAPASTRWEDLGTPADLAEAILRESAGGWIHPESHVDPSAVLGTDVVLEYGVRVGPGAHLSNCILLPGSEAAPGEHLDRLLRNPAGDLLW
ncbi:MAG: NTP transferase domain-containing protein [Fibrobacteria bacterium]|nr:NTP transferase domain-containing protein [Fibrobacteria bacterium]